MKESDRMKFTKMHGIGNDYVYVDCTKSMLQDPEAVSRFISDRHKGIGADGLILICPSEAADFRMAMYNADGSQGEMCGNGIRCVGKYVYEYGLTDKTSVSIETLAGIKHLDLLVEDGKVPMVRVDMGAPELDPQKIPVASDSEQVIAEPLTVGGETYEMTCVSMGNPHCVIFMDEVSELHLEKMGPGFENHPMFPNRINTEFAKIIDRSCIEMRVWERGSGETMACGTGACATAVAAVLNGLTDNLVTIKLLGGDLEIDWDQSLNTVFMTGPAEIVFDGEFDLAKVGELR